MNGLMAYAFAHLTASHPSDSYGVVLTSLACPTIPAQYHPYLFECCIVNMSDSSRSSGLSTVSTRICCIAQSVQQSLNQV
ncbi:unnamed protein product [Sympodiomycopsis kandeliae]